MAMDVKADFWQHYLVHTSAVMAEDSTKFAGARMAELSVLDGAIHKKWHLESPENMLRRRITLHHCIGGVVPETSHGVVFEGLGQREKLRSDIYVDKDMCAYLDPMSEFRGELIGGIYEDLMSLDRHVYGKKSIVIVPQHRVEEFHRKNPNFLGELVSFNAHQFSIKDKVNEVLHVKSPGTNLDATLNALLQNFTLESWLNFSTSFEMQFKDNNLITGLHNLSYFGALENLLNVLANEIRAARENKKNSLDLAADQIPAHLAMIRVICDAILHDLAYRLNEEKAFALMNWRDDILSWLNLFELEFTLRTQANTSIFLDNPQFEDFVAHRRDRQSLFELALGRMKIDEERLNLTSKMLLSSEEEKVAKFLEMPRLLILRDGLIKYGFADVGHTMLITRMLHELAQKPKYGANENDAMLKTSLRALTSCPRQKANLRRSLSNFIYEDETYKNEASLNFLNSESGQLLQQHLFGSSRFLQFDDLLRNHDATAILFVDLDVEENAKRFDVKPFQIAFTKVVRAWIVKQIYGDGCPAGTLICHGQRFSTANIKAAYATIIKPLNNYIFAGYLFIKADHPWQELIDQGCFISWNDIFFRSLPQLENLDEHELEAFKPLFNNLGVLHLTLMEYLENKVDGPNSDEQKIFAALDAREKKIRDFINDEHALWHGSWTEELSFLVRGQKRIAFRGTHPLRQISDITYLPHLPLAWALYTKLQGLINRNEKLSRYPRMQQHLLRRLAEIMKDMHAIVPSSNTRI